MDKRTVENLIDEILSHSPVARDLNMSYLVVIGTCQASNEDRMLVRDTFRDDVDHYLLQHARSVELLSGKESICNFDLMEYVDESKDVHIDSVKQRLIDRSSDIEDVCISDFSSIAVQELWMMLKGNDYLPTPPKDIILCIYVWDSTNIFGNESVVFTLEELAFNVLSGSKRVY